MSKRDNDRLKAIRKMLCCQCGAKPPNQAAHSNFSEHGKGRGIKADDKYTIPLCSECHQRFDGYCMSMKRDESLEWFNRKLESTNKTLRRVNDAAIQNYPQSF